MLEGRDISEFSGATFFGVTRCHMKGGQPTKTRFADRGPQGQVKMKSRLWTVALPTIFVFHWFFAHEKSSVVVAKMEYVILFHLRDTWFFLSSTLLTFNSSSRNRSTSF